jgi:hypothetical protein
MTVEPITIRPDRPVSTWQYRLWELLVARLPRWARVLVGRFAFRLPLGSRARRWWVQSWSVIVWDMVARRRYDLVLPIFDPACRWRFDANLVGLDFDRLYRGHEGIERGVEEWLQFMTEPRFTVREVLDGGDTWVLRMTFWARGARSGAPTQMDISSCFDSTRSSSTSTRFSMTRMPCARQGLPPSSRSLCGVSSDGRPGNRQCSSGRMGDGPSAAPRYSD